MDDGTHLDYGRLMKSAMRGLMVEVLGRVAAHGLPGEHHFYIGFDTRHPGVDMAQWLHDRYPREMVIVLQDWFEDLAVIGDRFRVTLNFSDMPQTLVIPFDAVQTFIDPSVKFGLKFDEDDDEEDEDETGEDAEDSAARDDPEPDPAPAGPSGSGADVVSLDRFRKT